MGLGEERGLGKRGDWVEDGRKEGGSETDGRTDRRCKIDDVEPIAVGEDGSREESLGVGRGGWLSVKRRTRSAAAVKCEWTRQYCR